MTVCDSLTAEAKCPHHMFNRCPGCGQEMYAMAVWGYSHGEGSCGQCGTKVEPTLQKVTAPWNQQQVDALNAFQVIGWIHPFTCGGDNAPRTNAHPDEVNLTATTDGWVCPLCDYTQDWAHWFMADETYHPKEPSL